MKQNKKPQWLIDAENAINEFENSKFGKLSDKEFRFSEKQSNSGKNAGLKAKKSGQFKSFAIAGGKVVGLVQGRKNVESGHLDSITPKSGSEEAKQRNIHRQKLMKERGTHNSQIVMTCPHCNKTGKGVPAMNRWHFNNCKKKGA